MAFFRGSADSVRVSCARLGGRGPLYRGLRLGNRIGSADVDPYAFEPQSVQAAGRGGAVEQQAQRERPVRSRREQGGREDGNAGVYEGHDLPLRARSEASIRPERKI